MPDGWLTTFQAFNLVGRDRFPDEWLDGKELAAPSDEEIEANREASARRESRAAERPRRIEKAKRASRSVVSGSDLPQVRTARPKRSAAPYKGQPFPVDVIADEGVRKAARERGDKAWTRLRQWSYDRTVKTICLDDHGRENEITRNDWGRWNARSMLFTGRATMNGRDSDVLISRADLEAAIRGEGEPEQAPSSEQSELAPRSEKSHPEKLPSSGQHQAHSNEVEHPEPEPQEGPRGRRKRWTEKKHQRWYELSQDFKRKGFIGATQLARKIVEREKKDWKEERKRLKEKGQFKDLDAEYIKHQFWGLTDATVMRRLNDKYRGWAD